MSWGRRDTWILAGLALAVLVLRLALLDADPPPDLQYHFLGDEGGWAHNARQKILFGRWIMDEHNPPLFAAPLYSVGLWAVYTLFGVGFLQTRLLSAVAGAAACVCLYLGLRGETSRRVSLAATALLGFSYFMLSYNRIGFVESFQLLFIALTAIFILRAPTRPIAGALAGLAFVLSILAKTSSVTMSPILGAYVLLEGIRMRRRGEAMWPLLISMSLFVAVCVGLLGITLVVFALPHWPLVMQEYASNAKIAMASNRGNFLTGLGIFGLDWDYSLERLNGFVRDTSPLLLGMTLLAVDRLTRGAREISRLELLAWCWLGLGALTVMLQQHQPDRRFLFLVPALAILVAIGLHEKALRWSSREQLAAATFAKRLLAGAALGAFVALLTRHRVIDALLQAMAGMPIGKHAGIARTTASALLMLGSISAGTLALGLLGSRVGLRRALPLGALVVAFFLVWDVARFAVYLVRPTYTMRDASRTIGSLTTGWAPSEKVAVGDVADTFSLETDLFAFLIRRWDDVDMWMNLDGWERFHPNVVLQYRVRDFANWPRDADEPFFEAPDGLRYPRVLLLELCPGRDDVARFELAAFVRPGEERSSPEVRDGPQHR